MSDPWGNLPDPTDPWASHTPTGQVNPQTGQTQPVSPATGSTQPVPPQTGRTAPVTPPTGGWPAQGYGQPTTSFPPVQPTQPYAPVAPTAVYNAKPRWWTPKRIATAFGGALLTVVAAGAGLASALSPGGDDQAKVPSNDKGNHKQLDEVPQSDTSRAIENHGQEQSSQTQTAPAQEQQTQAPQQQQTQQAPQQQQQTPTQGQQTQAAPQQTQSQPPQQNEPAPLSTKAPAGTVLAMNGKANPKLGVGVNNDGNIALFSFQKGAWTPVKDKKFGYLQKINTRTARADIGDPTLTITPDEIDSQRAWKVVTSDGSNTARDLTFNADGDSVQIVAGNKHVGKPETVAGTLNFTGTPSSAPNAPEAQYANKQFSPVSFDTAGKDAATSYTLAG
jgi:hypothetical protein